MRINNLYVGTIVVGTTREIQEREQPRPETADQPTAAEASFHTPSPELMSWQSLASQEPEVRGDVVDRVAALLVSGAFLTPECAQRTAQALLRSRE